MYWIKSIKNMRGRLQIIEKGSLKNLAPSNTVICDVAHNPSAGSAISNYLNTLGKNNKIYMICGMMNNKIHDKFLSNFKQVSEIVAVDIPNNENCIKKETLKIIIEKVGIKTKTSNSIQEAIKYIADKDKDAIIINMSHVPYIDASGIYVLEEVITSFKDKNMDVILVGVKDHIFKQFEDLKVIPNTLAEEKAYNSIRSGLKYLKNQLADEL